MLLMTGDMGCARARVQLRADTEPPISELPRPVSVRYVLEPRFMVPDRAFETRRGAVVAGLGARTGDVARTRAGQLIDLARFEAIRGREDACREHLRHALALAGPSSRSAVGLLRSSILGLRE